MTDLNTRIALAEGLSRAIEDQQWMFGGWGLTEEEPLAQGRLVAHEMHDWNIVDAR